MFLLCSTSPSNAAAAAASAASLDPYKALGLSRGCSQKDIKKAYRRAALKHHPDKVKESERDESERKFKDVNRAYEILSDENKKSLYDKYGVAALDPNFNPAFAGFGGGGGNSNGSGRRSSAGQQPFPFKFSPRGMGGGTPGDSSIDISSIMEEILKRQMGGTSSDGGSGPGPFGAAFSELFGASGFSGMSGMNGMSGMSGMNGMKGSSARSATPSSDKEYTRPFYCSLEELSNVKGCTKKLKVRHPAGIDPATGEQEIRERIYQIHVLPGWKEGTKVKFKAQQGFPPISFVLKEKGHSYLKRSGNDLIWDCTILPRQAARGAKLSIPLPNGETYKISTEHRAPMNSGETMRVPGKGMPIRRKKDQSGPNRGDLIIRFHIKEQQQQQQQQQEG